MNPFLSPFKNPFGGLIAGVSGPPKEGLLLYAKSTTDTIGESTYLLDESGNEYNVEVFGHTVLFDQDKFAALTRSVTHSGNFKIKVMLKSASIATTMKVLGSTATNFSLIGGRVWMYFSGWYSFTSLPTMSNDTYYEIVFERVGDQGTVTYGGSSQAKTVPETDFVVSYIGAESVTSTQEFIGEIPWIELYNSGNTLTNKWILESAKSLPQISFYDVEGGIHATIQDASGFQFTQKVTPTYLGEYGGASPTGMTNTGFAFYGGIQEVDFDTGSLVAGDNGGRTLIYNTTARRIRQDGYISKVVTNFTSFSVGDTFKVKVFRANGANYDYVGESESIAVVATGLQSHTLSTPVPCAQADIVGVYLSSSTLEIKTTTTTDGADSIKYAAGDISTTDSFSTALANQSLDIDAQGTAPFLAVTGDSIAEGHNTYNYWHSFYDDGPGGTPASEMANQLKALIDADGTTWGNYQNHAKQATTLVWVRSTGGVSAIATGAKAILLHVGINDVAAGATWATFGNMFNDVKELLKPGQHLFIDEIMPSTSRSDAESVILRDWNDNLATWGAANGATIISCHDAMGQTRVSTGELDDLLEAYSRDGTHLSQDGVDALAAIWKTALEDFYLSGDVYEIIPYGASDLPNTFDGALDAPEGTFVVNLPEEADLITADATEIFFNAGTAKDTDLATVPLNTGNNVFNGDSALLIYLNALTGGDISKAEKAAD